MIWERFPIALRFPVSDDAPETKRRCWEIALSALAAAPAETLEKLTLFEAFVQDAPGGAAKEYLCILHVYDVHFARDITAAWEKLPQLYARLVLHTPYWQQNPLDALSECLPVGTVHTDGTIDRTEAGKACLPERLPEAMQPAGNRRALIAGLAEPSENGWAEKLRSVGLAAAEAGMDAAYLPYALGGVGTAYALAYGQRGRLLWLPAMNTASEPIRVLMGVLPYGSAVIDAASVLTEGGTEPDSYALGGAVKAAMDRGYRKLILAMEGISDSDSGDGFFRALADPKDPEKTDPRFYELSLTLLTMNRALADGSQMTNGLFFRLARSGAVIRYAPDTMQARLQFAKRCAECDTLLLLGEADDPVSERILPLFEGKRIVRLPKNASASETKARLQRNES